MKTKLKKKKAEEEKHEYKKSKVKEVSEGKKKIQKKKIKEPKKKLKMKISLDDKIMRKIELEDCFNKLKHLVKKHRIRFLKLCEEYGDRYFKSQKSSFKKRCEKKS